MSVDDAVRRILDSTHFHCEHCPEINRVLDDGQDVAKELKSMRPSGPRPGRKALRSVEVSALLRQWDLYDRYAADMAKLKGGK